MCSKRQEVSLYSLYFVDEIRAFNFNNLGVYSKSGPG